MNCAKLFSINNHVLSQVIPSPSNGALQVQVKPSVSTLSLEHSAFESHGSDSHGSGTIKIKCGHEVANLF